MLKSLDTLLKLLADTKLYPTVLLRNMAEYINLSHQNNFYLYCNYKLPSFMSLINIKNCPICGSSTTAKVFSLVDHFSTKESFSIFYCLNCNFRFTNNFPTDDIIEKYYDSTNYISHSDSKKGLTNQMYHFFRKRMLKKKVNLVSEAVIKSRFSHVNKPNQSLHLLDVGCGTGYFLDAAKKQDYTVFGIEKDIKAREYAINNFELSVKSDGYLWDIENESFDVITLWHVLEHMQNLNKVIERINNILVPNGVLILALPNHESYDAKKYKEFWAAYDVPRHLWHFTTTTVERLLNKHQFIIIKQKSMPLDAFYISMLSEKYKGRGKFAQYTKAIITGSIGYLRSLSDIRQASSIIYIAKKQDKEKN